MFTGIIEDTGTVAAIEPTDKGMRLTLTTALDLSDTAIGDSIAVDGCCLTATVVSADRFMAEASHETLACTTLGDLTVGGRVNLERALMAGQRMGGHMVTGHVDTVARLESRTPNGEAVDLTFSFPTDYQSHLVPKGSVTIDGISLTVNSVGEGTFGVTIIPHTAQVTPLMDRAPGDPVNLETDIIGKYIVNTLKGHGYA